MPAQKAPSATKALVFGILGFVCCIIFAVLAIVYGNKTKQEVAASGGYLDGEGFGKAGVIMGWIAVGLWLLGAVLGLVSGVFTSGFNFGS